jgi:hypothetical protein
MISVSDFCRLTCFKAQSSGFPHEIDYHQIIEEHNRIQELISDMAKPVRLDLVLEGEAAKEFWKNEEITAFTPGQLAMFKDDKRIYRANRSGF